MVSLDTNKAMPAPALIAKLGGVAAKDQPKILGLCISFLGIEMFDTLYNVNKTFRASTCYSVFQKRSLGSEFVRMYSKCHKQGKTEKLSNIKRNLFGTEFIDIADRAGNRFDTDDFDALRDLFSNPNNFPRLVQIRFGEASKLTDEVFQSIFSQGFEHVRTLRFRRCSQLTDKVFNCFPKLFPNLQTLGWYDRRLNRDLLGIMPTQPDKFSPLANCTQLTDLEVSLDDSQHEPQIKLDKWGISITYIRNLKSLYIDFDKLGWYNFFSEDIFKQMAFNLRYLEELTLKRTEVRYSDPCGFTPPSGKTPPPFLAIVLDAFDKSRVLKRLDVKGMYNGDKDIMSETEKSLLANFVSNNPDIEVLAKKRRRSFTSI